MRWWRTPPNGQPTLPSPPLTYPPTYDDGGVDHRGGACGGSAARAALGVRRSAVRDSDRPVRPLPDEPAGHGRRPGLPSVRQVARPRLHGNVPLGRVAVARAGADDRGGAICLPHSRRARVRSVGGPRSTACVPERIRVLVRLRRRRAPVRAALRAHVAAVVGVARARSLAEGGPRSTPSTGPSGSTSTARWMSCGTGGGGCGCGERRRDLSRATPGSATRCRGAGRSSRGRSALVSNARR